MGHNLSLHHSHWWDIIILYTILIGEGHNLSIHHSHWWDIIFLYTILIGGTLSFYTPFSLGGGGIIFLYTILKVGHNPSIHQGGGGHNLSIHHSHWGGA